MAGVVAEVASGAKIHLGAEAENEVDARTGACTWVEATAFGRALSWDSSWSWTFARTGRESWANAALEAGLGALAVV